MGYCSPKGLVSEMFSESRLTQPLTDLRSQPFCRRGRLEAESKPYPCSVRVVSNPW